MSPTVTFLPYSDDLEVITPDEDALVDAIVKSMAAANAEVFDKHRHGLRDAHAKSHGILRAELEILPNLPAPYRQGLFAGPASYAAIVRLSTAPGDLRSDKVNTQRGMAVKVIGVPGERVDGGDDVTQDLLMVNSPTLPFGTVHAYAKLRRILENQPSQSDKELQTIGRRARRIAKALAIARRPLPAPIAIAAASNNNILGETFHTMAALRYGDFVAKISAAPSTSALRQFVDAPIDASDSALRDMVVDHFRTKGGVWDIRAQLGINVHATPVEDASILWPESISPHTVVARLRVAPQNAYSEDRRIFADDVLSFNPWNSLVAHRPLGSIMRSRRKVYESSSDFRHAMNRVATCEPRSIDELPD